MQRLHVNNEHRRLFSQILKKPLDTGRKLPSSEPNLKKEPYKGAPERQQSTPSGV
jgi:hypothetical protein